mgnify:FL=1|jgi:hypothetical protein|tara:strand:+ start:3198 stop:3362 length:165 start_codon:yes stop_codon:yes gene_type:complete
MNLKMISYYEDVLMHTEKEEHKIYAKAMLDYYKGKKSKPIMMNGVLARKYLKCI